VGDASERRLGEPDHLGDAGYRRRSPGDMVEEADDPPGDQAGPDDGYHQDGDDQHRRRGAGQSMSEAIAGTPGFQPGHARLILGLDTNFLKRHLKARGHWPPCGRPVFDSRRRPPEAAAQLDYGVVVLLVMALLK